MDYDPSAMFSGYRTFMWMPREHHPARNRAVSARAQEAIEAELVSKGFSRAADAGSADFAIDFRSGRKIASIFKPLRPYSCPMKQCIPSGGLHLLGCAAQCKRSTAKERSRSTCSIR